MHSSTNLRGSGFARCQQSERCQAGLLARLNYTIIAMITRAFISLRAPRPLRALPLTARLLLLLLVFFSLVLALFVKGIEHLLAFGTSILTAASRILT